MVLIGAMPYPGFSSYNEDRKGPLLSMESDCARSIGIGGAGGGGWIGRVTGGSRCMVC